MRTGPWKGDRSCVQTEYTGWQLQAGPTEGAQTQGSAQGRWVLLTVPVSTYCAGTLTVAHRALAGDHLTHTGRRARVYGT